MKTFYIRIARFFPNNKYNINPKQREKESLYKQTHKVRVDSTVETQALYFQLNLENFRRLN